MNELFQANIKKSIKFLSENQGYIKLLYDLQSAYFMMVEKDHKLAQITPSFHRDDATRDLLIDDALPGLVPSSPSLTHYTIKHILRSVLLGLRFMQSGDVLIKSNFYASSIFSYYTTSFHFLQSFLASNGNVIIRPTNIQSNQLNLNNGLIVARLTRHNQWVFHGLSQSHGAVWKELAPILKKMEDDVPERFLFFFKYILAPNKAIPSDVGSLVQEGLNRLTQIRHESIYEGYGFDDYVFDGLINKDETNPFQGIEHKSIAYRLFAIEFLNLCLNDIFELKKNSLDPYWSAVEKLFTYSILIPPFESGIPELLDAPELKTRVNDLFLWLKMGH